MPIDVEPTQDPALPPPAGTPAATRQQLDRALIRGVAWTGGLKWATQLVSWGITLGLARILSPGDYGIFGLATLYVGFIQLVNEFGLGAAIIRRRDFTEPQIAAIGGVTLALGGVLWLLALLTAPLYANFFHAPEARWPIAALSAVFVLTAIKTIPKSLLSRDLAFKQVALLDAVEALLAGFVTLGLALMGLRHWALVGGTLVGGVVGAVVAVALRPQRLRWPASFGDIAPAVNFGSHIMVSRLSWYAYSNADFAVVGRRLGPALLGAYSYGWTIASIPVDRISAMVGQVTPALFSAVQHDLPEVRRYLIRVTEALALVTLPLSVGLATVADQFTVVVLGDRWWPAVGPLAMLSVYASARAVTTIYPHVLQALGQSGRAMRFNLIGVAVLLPLFLVGSHWGVSGVALAWIIGYPAIALPMLRAVLRASGLSLSEYFDAIRPPLRASIIMAATVLAVRTLLPADWPLAVQFALAVGSGVLAYAGVMLGVYGDHLRTLRILLRDIRR